MSRGFIHARRRRWSVRNIVINGVCLLSGIIGFLIYMDLSPEPRHRNRSYEHRVQQDKAMLFTAPLTFPLVFLYFRYRRMKDEMLVVNDRGIKARWRKYTFPPSKRYSSVPALATTLEERFYSYPYDGCTVPWKHVIDVNVGTETLQLTAIDPGGRERMATIPIDFLTFSEREKLKETIAGVAPGDTELADDPLGY